MNPINFNNSINKSLDQRQENTNKSHNSTQRNNETVNISKSLQAFSTNFKTNITGIPMKTTATSLLTNASNQNLNSGSNNIQLNSQNKLQNNSNKSFLSVGTSLQNNLLANRPQNQIHSRMNTNKSSRVPMNDNYNNNSIKKHAVQQKSLPIDPKSMSYLQAELMRLTKDLKNLDYETIKQIITKSLAITINQVNTIGKNKGIKDPLKTIIEKTPTNITKILSVALQQITHEVTNGKVKFLPPPLTTSNVKPIIKNNSNPSLTTSNNSSRTRNYNGNKLKPCSIPIIPLSKQINPSSIPLVNTLNNNSNIKDFPNKNIVTSKSEQISDINKNKTNGISIDIKKSTLVRSLGDVTQRNSINSPSEILPNLKVSEVVSKAGGISGTNCKTEIYKNSIIGKVEYQNQPETSKALTTLIIPKMPHKGKFGNSENEEGTQPKIDLENKIAINHLKTFDEIGKLKTKTNDNNKSEASKKEMNKNGIVNNKKQSTQVEKPESTKEMAKVQINEESAEKQQQILKEKEKKIDKQIIENHNKLNKIINQTNLSDNSVEAISTENISNKTNSEKSVKIVNNCKIDGDSNSDKLYEQIDIEKFNSEVHYLNKVLQSISRDGKPIVSDIPPLPTVNYKESLPLNILAMSPKNRTPSLIAFEKKLDKIMAGEDLEIFSEDENAIIDDEEPNHISNLTKPKKLAVIQEEKDVEKENFPNKINFKLEVDPKAVNASILQDTMNKKNNDAAVLDNFKSSENISLLKDTNTKLKTKANNDNNEKNPSVTFEIKEKKTISESSKSKMKKVEEIETNNIEKKTNTENKTKTEKCHNLQAVNKSSSSLKTSSKSEIRKGNPSAQSGENNPNNPNTENNKKEVNDKSLILNNWGIIQNNGGIQNKTFSVINNDNLVENKNNEANQDTELKVKTEKTEIDMVASETLKKITADSYVFSITENHEIEKKVTENFGNEVIRKKINNKVEEIPLEKSKIENFEKMDINISEEKKLITRVAKEASSVAKNSSDEIDIALDMENFVDVAEEIEKGIIGVENGKKMNHRKRNRDKNENEQLELETTNKMLKI
ncbi:uncharacterized protein ASCRUDRAFT_75498 [Ascoidea rubescens DSM 1968]|uniref:Uncharacterized protein n=1 Tax=Ascoidea rubescens DSM 1968 TaxID=1344418 RepID=A0A1D2VJ42_9ASCO|nr:hypothetical protein ASCRUDRAFT_75498 [Ascoidea rubescens DSM 1968]ODV61497.1 hypothetical protein ASCRUDRAFT_75498 [Ascoidea rubescens DSM 1968]